MLMKGRGRTWAVACVLAAVSLIFPGTAQSGDPVGKLSVAFCLGVSGYAMDAINNGIDRSNQWLGEVSESSNWELPERINQGLSMGGDLNFDLTSGIRVGVIYGSTWGSSGVDFMQKIDIEPRTDYLYARALLRLPYRPTENTSLRAFAGPIILLGSETKVTHENTSDSGRRIDSMVIEGSGTGFGGGVAGEYTLGDRFSLSFEVGYQYAKASFDSGDWSIAELEDPLGDDDGDGVRNDQDPVKQSYLWGFFNERYADPEADPPQETERPPTVRQDLDIDFSGFMLQAGFRVYLF